MAILYVVFDHIGMFEIANCLKKTAPLCKNCLKQTAVSGLLGALACENSYDFLCVRHEIRLVEQHPSKLVLHSLASALIK